MATDQLSTGKITRKQFIRRVGIGAAAAGAAGLGLSGTTLAQSVPSPEVGAAQEAVNPDGSKRYLLLVGPAFKPSDLAEMDQSARLEWHWKEAGIAVVSSFSPTFMQDAEGGLGNINIENAVPDMNIPAPAPASFSSDVEVTAAASIQIPPVPDAFAQNVQWYLQAIGAVMTTNALTPPEWLLKDSTGFQLTGRNVVVGIVDSGVPAYWPGYDGSKPLNDPGNLAAKADATLNPEYKPFDPVHPEEGGVVLPEQYWHDSPEPAPNRLVDWDNTLIRDQLPLPHSTIITSAIGAQHTSFPGAMRGLAPKATIICYKVVDPEPIFPQYFLISRIIRAWFLAIADGVQVLNNSHMIYLLPTEIQERRRLYEQIYLRANNELYRNGVLSVCSAGNNSRNMDTDLRTMMDPQTFGLPQDFPNVINVGSTGPRDYVPYGSVSPVPGDLSVYNPFPGTPEQQKGPSFNLDRFASFSNYGSNVDVVAPGGEGQLITRSFFSASNPRWWWQGIYGAYPYYNVVAYNPPPFAVPNPSPFGLHTFAIGTSASAPIVSGVAALAAEAYERAYGKKPSATELAVILKRSADDLVGPATDAELVWNNDTLKFENVADEPCDTPGKDHRYRFGRVNARKAIELAQTLHGQ